MAVAILALQGAFIEHKKKLEALGAECFEIRQASDLERPFDRVVLPGGESTTQAKLLHELGLMDPLRKRIKEGMPVLATCAGLILLAETVDGTGDLDNLNPAAAQNRLQVKGLGTMPITVRRNIQYACAEAARPVRPTDVLETAKAELDRIMAEDIPRMACADDSLVQNADWKDAIEVVNLLDIARLTVEASLAREESRDAFIRPDFPETDDENWKCALAYTRAEDGTLSYEKIPY